MLDKMKKVKTLSGAEKKEAQKIASKMRKTGYKGARPYLCLFCNQWHNGHPKPSAFDDNGLIIDEI